MAWRVEYQDRTGKPAQSPAFGNEALAKGYARTVKGGKVVPVAVEAPPVQVTVCADPATVDAQRAQEREALLNERLTEAGLEAFHGARHGGASVSDALDEGRDARGQVLAEQDPGVEIGSERPYRTLGLHEKGLITSRPYAINVWRLTLRT